MKSNYLKIVIFIFTLQAFAIKVSAQAPPLINYQAVARDGTGVPVASQSVALKFEFKQGSSTVFSETQSNIFTNASGLFSTQIGKINTTGLSSVNWQGGNLSLEVSMDLNNGSSFTSFGLQQLVSVPYAMHASSVPATYSNNILTIGSQSFTLSASTGSSSPQTTITSSGIGTITSAGTNTFDINIPATNLTGAGSATVSGSFPNYTVTTPTAGQQSTLTSSGIGTVTSAGTNSFNINIPAPGYNAATGALTTGTSVTNITPTLGLSGSVLNVGPPTNTITLPAGITPTINGAGATTVTGTYPNLTVNTPTPVLTGIGSATVSGAFPNYTINTPAAGVTPTINGAGATTVTGTYPNLIVNTPTPVLTGIGSATVSGAFPNYTINTPAAGVTPTINGTGATTVTGTYPSLTVNTPTPVLTGAGSATVNGAFPNYTITTPAAGANTVVGTGLAVVSPTTGNNFTVNVPPLTYTAATGVLGSGSNTVLAAPTLTLSGGVLTSGPSSNSVAIPGATTPSISGSGIAVVSPTVGNSFTVTVPATSVTASGVASITSASSNSFNVNVPAPAYNATTGVLTTGPATTNVVPTLTLSGGVLTSGPSSNSVAIPGATTPSISGAGIAVVSPTVGNSFTVTVPATSVTASGIASITSVSSNSFNINVPAPAYNQASGALTLGTATANITPTLGLSGSVLTVGAVTNTISLPSAVTPTITGTGATTVSGTYPNLTVSSPSTALSGVGSATVLGAFPNYTIATPPVPSPTVTGTGLATVSPTTGISFTVDVPSPAYTASTGVLAFGANSVIAAPTLSLSGNVLTSGPAGNSVTIPSSPWTQTGGTVSIAASSVNIGIGTNAPTAALTVDNQSLTARTAVQIQNARDQVGSGMPLLVDMTTLGQTFGSTTYGRIIRLSNSNLLASFDMGIDQNSSFFLTRLNTYNPSADFVINSSGFTGLGKSSPSERLDVSGNVRFSGALMPNNNAGTAGQVLTSAGAGAVPVWTTATSAGWNLTGNAGTSTLTNFIGTTDNVSLLFKQSNVSSGRIDALNTFFGRASGSNISTGVSNTGIGVSTLLGVTTGSYNSALGESALAFNSSGSGNTAQGYGAAYATTGSNNVSLGYYANLTNTSGSNNVTIGTQAGNITTSLNGAVAIGYNAKVGLSNAMVLGDTTNVNVGLGTGYPSQKLDVRGNVRFSGVLMPNNNAGTAGQFLQSSGAGSAPVWTTMASASGWGLTGNAGTNGSTNFLGTSDAQDLVFKTNNTEAVRVFSTGNVAIGNPGQAGGRLNVNITSSATYSYGINANLNYNPSSGAGGVVAGGYFSNYTSGTGGGTQLNTALTGYLSVSGNNTSQNNTGGWMHTISTGGTHSNLIGVMGTYENYGGTINNAYGGYFEHYTNTGSINNGYGVYIGSILGNNKWSLYSADVAASSYFAGKVGIGTSGAPTAALDVKGAVKITDGTQGMGKVLTSDGLGNASWQTAAGGGLSGGTADNIPKWGSATTLSPSLLYDNGSYVNIGNNATNFSDAALLVSVPGAFDNRVIITGGDNNNSYGGILSFAENLNQVAGMSIKLDAGSNELFITSDLAGNNPIVGIGGYSGTNPGVVIGSGYAFSNPPSNGLAVEGNIGVGVPSPSEKLEVAGNVQIPASNDYKYASARTSYVTIAPAAFTGLDAYTIGGNSSGNARWIASGSTGSVTQMFAPVNLPDGAIVTSMDIYIRDSDASYDVSAELVRFNMGINIVNSLATTPSSSGTPGQTFLTSSGINTTIDNSTYSYYITFNTLQNSPNLWIRGARITYTVLKAD